MMTTPHRIVTLVLLVWFLTATACLANLPIEVIHEGKTVEQWFQEYVSGASTRTPPQTPPVVNGELLWPSPAAGAGDPAWEAFNVMGSNAVPWLVHRLEASAGATNAEPSRLERRQVIELIQRLETTARSAAPSLLTLLKQADESEAEAVCAAIASVRPEPLLINQFLLDLGKAQRNADMLYYARRLGWSGSDVAQLLGGLLRSPDRDVIHDAAALLEAAGPGAQAAVEQITGALQNADQEIRYLAARSLAGMATNTPAARKALQGLIDDQNEMVRRVARRAVQ